MATFGKTAIGAVPSTQANPQQWANSRVLPVNGTVTQMSMYLDNPGVSAENITVAIWADSAGSPGALLANSSPATTIAPSTAAGWVNFTVSVVLTAGTYWLGIAATGSGTLQVRRYVDAAANGTLRFNASTGPTNPFGAPSSFTDDVSLYATYTAAGSGAGTNLPLLGVG